MLTFPDNKKLLTVGVGSVKVRGCGSRSVLLGGEGDVLGAPAGQEPDTDLVQLEVLPVDDWIESDRMAVANA